MSALSNVAVVPDYNENTNDQALIIANQALANSTTADATSNLAVTNSTNAVNTANQSNTNSQTAISRVPFFNYSFRSTGYTPINTFTPVTSITFNTTAPNSKMIFWANLSIQDNNIIPTGSVFQAQITVSTISPAVSYTSIVTLPQNYTQTVSLFYPFTGDPTAGSLTAQLMVLTASGGLLITNAQLMGIINIQ